MAGTDSTSTSRAMYQLSQAMSSGSVRLMDWKSLETANITGERFKETIKETAKAHNIDVDAMIKKEGSFRETLKSGWLTADLMAEVLNHYTLSLENMTEEEIKANKVKMKANGYTDAQIDKLFKLGTEANDAATKVKTFTQLWGVLQESAQSGWSKSWQIIIGDFEEAKSFLTPVADALTKIISKSNDARNALLESALGKSAKNLFDNAMSAMNTISEVTEAVEENIKSLVDYKALADDIISGVWGNGQERWDKLADAGYDWAQAQNTVNEKLGSTVRHATDYIETEQKLNKAQAKSNDKTKEYLKTILKKNDTEIESLGYTKEQIKSFNELKKMIDKTGLSVDFFIDHIDEIDGRWLLINSFKNIGKSIYNIFKGIKQAFAETFPVTAEGLFNIITSFHKLTTELQVNEEMADKIRRTIKGVLAVVKLGLKILTGPIRLAFKLVTALLKASNIDILDITASVGDFLVKITDFIEETFNMKEIAEALLPIIKKIYKRIKELFDYLSNTKFIKKVVKLFDAFGNGLKNIWHNMKEWFNNLRESDNMGLYILQGLLNGLTNGFNKVKDFIVHIFTNIIDTAKKILGIHSPSKEFFDIGRNIVLGLMNGIKSSINMSFDIFRALGEGLINIFKNMNIGTVLASLVVVAPILMLIKIVNAVVSIFSGIGHISNNISKLADSLGDLVTTLKFKIEVNMVKDILLALTALAGVVFLLAHMEEHELINAIVAVGALAIIMAALVGLAAVLAHFTKYDASTQITMKEITGVIISIALAAMLISRAVSDITSMIKDNDLGIVIEAFVAFIGSIASIIALVKAMSFLSLGKSTKTLLGVSTIFITIGFTIKMLMHALKYVSGMKTDELRRSILTLGSVFLLLYLFLVGLYRLIDGRLGTGLFKTAKLEGIKNMGNALKDVATSMLLIIGSIAVLGLIPTNILIKGGIVAGIMATVLLGIIYVLTRINKASDKVGGPERIGKPLMAIAGSIALLGMVISLIGLLPKEVLLKGTGVVTILTGVLALMIIILLTMESLTNKSEEVNDKKPRKAFEGLARSVISMALAVAAMAVVAALMGTLPEEALKKGVAAVAILGLVVAAILGLSGQTKNAKPATILFVGALIGALGYVFIKIAKMPVDNVEAATMAIAGTLISISILLAIIGSIGKKSTKKSTINTLSMVGISLLALAGVLGTLYLLSKIKINDKKIMSVLKMTSVLGLIMVGISVLRKKIGRKSFKNVLKTVAISLGILVTIIGTLKLLSMTNVNASQLSSVIIMVLVLGTIMSGLAILSSLMTHIKGGLLETLGIAAMALGSLLGIVGILWLMEGLDKALINAIALGKLSVSLIELMSVMAIIGAVASKLTIKLSTVLGVALIALGSMALIVGVLWLMEGLNKAATNAKALVKVMKALNEVMIVMGVLGLIMAATGFWGLAGVGGMALIAVVYAGLIVGVLWLMEGLKKAEENSQLLITIMKTLDEVFISMASLGFNALTAAAGAVIMGIALLVFIGVSYLLSYLAEKSPEFKKFIEKGSPLLIKVAKAIGEAAAALISAVSDSFPEIGENLEDFSDSFVEFAKNINSVKSVNLQPLRDTVEFYKTLTGATVTGGWHKFQEKIFGIPGDPVTPETIGKDLIKFSSYIKEFAENIKDLDKIDFDALNKLQDYVERIFNPKSSWAQAGEAVGGILGNIGGMGESITGAGKDFLDDVLDRPEKIKSFGKAMQKIGSAVSEFVEDVTTIRIGDDFNKDTVTIDDDLIDYVQSVMDFFSDAVSLVNSYNINREAYHAVGNMFDNLGTGIQTLMNSTNIITERGFLGIPKKSRTATKEEIKERLGLFSAIFFEIKRVTKDAAADETWIEDFNKISENLKTWLETLTNDNIEILTDANNDNKYMEKVRNYWIDLFLLVVEVIKRHDEVNTDGTITNLSAKLTSDIIAALTDENKMNEAKEAGTSLMNSYLEGLKSKETEISTFVSSLSNKISNQLKINSGTNPISGDGFNFGDLGQLKDKFQSGMNEKVNSITKDLNIGKSFDMNSITNGSITNNYSLINPESGTSTPISGEEFDTMLQEYNINSMNFNSIIGR